MMNRLLGIQFLSVFDTEPETSSACLLPEYGTLTCLKKSHNSAAASISACHAFFPWPAIVTAIMSYRYFVEIRSAALRKMLARSANGVPAHDFRAVRAASMAASTSALEALE
jgi:hypothetical protein